MLHAGNDYNERIQDSKNIIPVDEPVFLLRGQDALAPVILDIYVVMSKQHPECDLAIVKAVREHASAMRLWQSKHGSKLADMDAKDSVY